MEIKYYLRKAQGDKPHLETLQYLDEFGEDCSESKGGRLKMSVVSNYVFDLSKKAFDIFSDLDLRKGIRAFPYTLLYH